jgi:hypothetical protein
VEIKIKFVDISKTISEQYYPTPAKKAIPDWYKKIEGFLGGVGKVDMTKTATNATVKKCIPFLDAITSGYIIYSSSDVLVRKVEGETVFQWPDLPMIRFQKSFQIEGYPEYVGKEDVPKWKNPWAIITPKGYSCFITTPMHRGSLFTVLEGVVDTDSYFNPIQFPFILKSSNWEGIIPAGTPIAQVIPFRREEFLMEVVSDNDSIEKIYKSNKLLVSKFFDSYKKIFWNRKSYN